MKNKKRLFITMVLLLVTLTVLVSAEIKEHCGKHFPQASNETTHDEVCGTVQIVDNNLQVVQDSTAKVFNLVIPENMEKEAGKIEVGKKYVFTGNSTEHGFIVDKFSLVEISEKAGHHVVDSKKCIGCRLCISHCPEGAISMVKGKAVIDQEKCTDCGTCVDGDGHFKGCPVKAIEKK